MHSRAVASLREGTFQPAEPAEHGVPHAILHLEREESSRSEVVRKAASETLMLWLVRGLREARPRRKHLHVPYRPSARDHRYFTFVREPIDAALAGYAELSRRSLFSLSQAKLARQHGWTNVTAAAREQARVVRAVPYLRIPCSRAADRLRSFLDGVEHGRPLGDQAYHVYPQAMKLAAAPRLRLYRPGRALLG